MWNIGIDGKGLESNEDTGHSERVKENKSFLKGKYKSAMNFAILLLYLIEDGKLMLEVRGGAACRGKPWESRLHWDKP